MRVMIIVITLVIVSGASSAFAQSSRKKKRLADDTELQSQPNSVDPNNQTNNVKEKKPKTSSVKPNRNPEQEFYERMAEIEKTRRRNEKMMDKPEYSDPMYFGHKKPPRKHKPSKMKYCKVCGIRH